MLSGGIIQVITDDPPYHAVRVGSPTLIALVLERVSSALIAYYHHPHNRRHTYLELEYDHRNDHYPPCIRRSVHGAITAQRKRGRQLHAA